MAPDPDFDARVRQALSGEVAGAPFDDASGSARTAVVAGVRRRHRRRLEVLGGVSAALVAVALVAVVGLGSGGPSPSHTVEGERGAATSVPSTSKAAPSAHAPAFGVAGAPPRATAGGRGAANAPQAALPEAPNAACPVARVGATVTVCAGSFAAASGPAPADAVAGSGATGYERSSSSVAQGSATGSSTAAKPVDLRVGQTLRVTLPSSALLDHWTRPTVSSGSAVLEASGPAKALTTGGWTATFRAVRPGTATVTSHATCGAQAKGSTALAPVCTSSTARWSLTVVVTR